VREERAKSTPTKDGKTGISATTDGDGHKSERQPHQQFHFRKTIEHKSGDRRPRLQQEFNRDACYPAWIR
jgi:hypothetical protein